MGPATFKLSSATAVVLLCVLASCGISQCHPCEAYERSDANVMTQCNSLIKSFEAVLLTDSNLYILRDTFASTEHNPPTVLTIDYIVIYSNGSDLELDIENFSELAYGWTSSSVYAVVDPMTIFALETGMLALVYNSADEKSFFPHITLELNISSTPIETTDYSKDELYFALKTITALLRVYAQYQDKIKSWDGKENKGYIWKYKLNPSLVQAEFYLLIFAFIASFKVGLTFIKRLQDQQSPQFFPAIFWALTVVCFAWNVVDLLFNIIFLSMLFNRDATDHNSYYAISKLVVLCLVFVFSFIWILLGCFVSPSLMQPPRCVPPFCCCTCCCTKKGKNRYYYSCAFFNISFFLFLVTANIIPVIILVIVNPVTSLSVVVLLTTLFFAHVTAGMIVTFITLENKKHRKFWHFEFVCYLVLAGLFGAFMYFMVYLYLEIVIKGADPSDYFKVLFSFILSAGLGAATYLFKKTFLNHKGRKLNEKETPSDNVHTEQTDISLAEIEEGQGALKVNETSENGNGDGLKDERKMNTDSQGPNSED